MKLSLLITFILMIGIVSAVPSAPNPIAIKIDAIYNSGLEVTIKNLGTGLTHKGTTQANGEYVIDWSTVGDDIQDLNVIKVTVEDVSIEKTYFNGAIGGGEVYYFDFREPQDPVIPCDATECEDILCPEDTTPYAECNTCCTDGPDKECPDYPETEGYKLEVLIGSISVALLAGVLGTLGYGRRLKFFEYLKIWRALEKGEGVKVTLRRNSDGTLDLSLKSHKHLGRTTYHSIYSIHRNNPHPKGVINPNYGIDGKYIGEG